MIKLHTNTTHRALVSISLEDVNEFGPEFERQLYSAALDIDATLAPPEVAASESATIDADSNNDKEELLMQLKAHDQDCSVEFGSVCRYEMLGLGEFRNLNEFLSLDLAGRLRVRRRKLVENLMEIQNGLSRQQLTFQVIAYDCGGKKSQVPAQVQLNLNKLCKPQLKGK